MAERRTAEYIMVKVKRVAGWKEFCVVERLLRVQAVEEAWKLVFLVRCVARVLY